MLNIREIFKIGKIKYKTKKSVLNNYPHLKNGLEYNNMFNDVIKLKVNNNMYDFLNLKDNNINIDNIDDYVAALSRLYHEENDYNECYEDTVLRICILYNEYFIYKTNEALKRN